MYQFSNNPGTLFRIFWFCGYYNASYEIEESKSRKEGL